MRPSLIIRFASDPAQAVHWFSLDEQGRPRGAGDQGSLQQAAEAARGHGVIVLLPATDLLLTEVRIPSQSRQRVLQALPYALEEQISGDVEEQHFALGPRLADDRYAVAVIAHSVLDRWRAAAAEAGLRLEQLYPDVQALPVSAGHWSLLLDGERFLLRTGPQAGFAGDRDTLKFFLEGALEEAGEQPPEALDVHHVDDLRESDELALDLPLRVERFPTDDAHALLAQGLDPSQAIPLLSGAYAVRGQGGGEWQRWKLAAGLLLAWALVDTGGALLERWELQREYRQLSAQVEDVYRQAFPDSTRVLYPRRQMESRLAALRGGGGDSSGLLPMLDAAGPALAQADDLRLQGIRYQAGTMDLELSAAGIEQLDSLQSALDALDGLRAETRSAQSEGERIAGQLHLESGS